jgi:hypothetical protein
VNADDGAVLDDVLEHVEARSHAGAAFFGGFEEDGVEGRAPRAVAPRHAVDNEIVRREWKIAGVEDHARHRGCARGDPIDEKSQVVRGSSVCDLVSRTWSTGPELPGGNMNGFGPAAVVVRDKLYVSVDDGGLYRESGGTPAWTKVGQATPRIVHRLVADGDRVLIVGGAFGGKNSDLVEAVALAN